MPSTEELTLSNQNFDPETGYRYAEITPRHFSFNSPQGACPGLRRARHRIGLRSRAAHSRRLGAAGGHAGRAVAPRRARPGETLSRPVGGAGRGLQRADVAALSRMRRRFPARAARRHGRRENQLHHHAQRQDGRDGTALRGPHRATHPPSRREQKRTDPPPAASVHDAHHLPRLPRRAAAARGAGRDARRRRPAPGSTSRSSAIFPSPPRNAGWRPGR